MSEDLLEGLSHSDGLLLAQGAVKLFSHMSGQANWLVSVLQNSGAGSNRAAPSQVPQSWAKTFLSDLDHSDGLLLVCGDRRTLTVATICGLRHCGPARRPGTGRGRDGKALWQGPGVAAHSQDHLDHPIRASTATEGPAQHPADQDGENDDEDAENDHGNEPMGAEPSQNSSGTGHPPPYAFQATRN
jgi:hypothetical protein